MWLEFRLYRRVRLWLGEQVPTPTSPEVTVKEKHHSSTENIKLCQCWLWKMTTYYRLESFLKIDWEWYLCIVTLRSHSLTGKQELNPMSVASAWIVPLKIRWSFLNYGPYRWRIHTPYFQWQLAYSYVPGVQYSFPERLGHPERFNLVHLDRPPWV